MNNVIDPELKKKLDQILEEDKIENVLRKFEMLKQSEELDHEKLFDNLLYLIRIYSQETKRLKASISSDGVLSLIDAYNKGMLRDHESFIDDLLLTLDESFR